MSRLARLRPVLVEGATAAAVYLALAVAFTWPLALHLRSQVLGLTGFENTPQTIWLYAQWKTFTAAGVRDLLGPAPLDPTRIGAFVWSQLAFPVRISMANGIDFIPTWVLDRLFGFPGYYNVKCLLILATNALGAHALLRGLGGSRAGAYLAGSVFAFNPFMLYELVTGRLIETIAMPLALYALCLVRAWRDDEPVAWLVGGGVALGVSTLVYWFDGWFLFAFTLLFLGFSVGAAALRGELRARLPRLGAMLLIPLVALPLILPAAMPYLVKLHHGDRIPGSIRVDDGRDPMEALSRQLMTWSCKADYPFRAPRVGQPFSPPWNMPGMMTFSAVLSAVAVVCLFLVPKGQRFWIVAFGALYLVPLGPALCLDGQVLSLGGRDVPMPYYFMAGYLPFLDRLFFPNQTMVLWVMACAVVIGLGLSRLRPRVAWTVAAVVLVLAAAEMHHKGVLPVATSPVVIPPLYLEARDKPDEGFIYVPVNLRFWEREGRNDRELYNGTDLTHIDYHMAMHGRKSLWGRNQYLAGDAAWMFEPPAAMTNTFLRWLLDIDRADERYDAADVRAVRDNGFRWIVVLERFCSHPPARGGYRTDLAAGRKGYDEICARLRARLGAPVFEGDDPSWDRWIVEDGVVPHTYRMAIFAIPDSEGGAP